jgi:hypothetical protein
MSLALSVRPPLDRVIRRSAVLDAVLVLGVLASYFAVSRLPVGPKRFGDDIFHEDAKLLASALRCETPWSSVRVRAAPGPVFFYAIPYAIASPRSSDSDRWRLAFIANGLATICAVLLLRRAADLLAGPPAGTVAALLGLVCPFAQYYSFGVSAEPLAYLGVAILVYGWALLSVGLRRRESMVGTAATALGLATVIAARPNAILLLLGVAALSALWWRRSEGLRRRAARRLAIASALASVALVLAVVPIMFAEASLREYPQSVNLYHVLVQGAFQYRTEPLDWRTWEPESRAGSVDFSEWTRTSDALRRVAAVTNRTLSSIHRQWIVDDLSAHPVIRFRALVVRVVTLQLWRANSVSPDRFDLFGCRGPGVFYAFHAALNCILLGLALVVARLLWSVRGNLGFHWGLWLPWTSLTLFHALTYAEPRYMFPALPSLFVGAGVSLSRHRRRTAQRCCTSRSTRWAA